MNTIKGETHSSIANNVETTESKMSGSACGLNCTNFRGVHKIDESDYKLRHVCTSLRPSVRMDRLASHRMDLHEI